jgi:hypothetical protein
MDPFIAVCFVALNPFAWNFFHAYYAVLIILIVLVAFHAKNNSFFNKILLVF